MASRSPFLDLPTELRDLILEYVALDAGIDLHPETGAKPTSWTPLSLVCHQLHNEYEDVLDTSAPIVNAYVRDFDFNHLIDFLDQLHLRARRQRNDNVSLYQSRELRIFLIFTPSSPPPARQNLEKLHEWLIRYSNQSSAHYLTAFKTKYFVHRSCMNGEKNAVAPVTLMRITDDIYCNWFMKSLPGPLKEEVGKVCDCLYAVELEINRRRSQPL